MDVFEACENRGTKAREATGMERLNLPPAVEVQDIAVLCMYCIHHQCLLLSILWKVEVYRHTHVRTRTHTDTHTHTQTIICLMCYV